MQRVYRGIFCAFLVLLFDGTLLRAAAPASFHGTITNASGTPIAGAHVTVTTSDTGVSTSSVTGPDGSFDLSGLASGTYNVVSTMQGFVNYTQNGIILQPGQTLSLQITMKLSSESQSVTVTAEGSPETSVTQAVISRAEIEGIAGPFGSAAQALTAAPGVFVYGYGGVAATARSEVVVRGIKGGWSSVNGDVLRNGITFLLDGIPMNNMISNNGAWQTTQIPIMDMISNINVDYGPGAPSNRWFDSLGGTVNYIPAQPKSTPGPAVTFGSNFGSYNTYIEHFIANTGVYKGWSGILASGYASNDTFRVGTTGIPTFTAPSSGYSTYAKVHRVFDQGSFSIGYYHGRNTEYRPNFVPLVPITPASNNNYGDAVTTTGLYGPDAQPGSTIPGNVQYYSQPTSGYYSSLAKALWFKQIKTQSDIVYSKLHVALSPRMIFNNSEWYRHGYRLHNRVTNYYGSSYTQTNEWYDPASNTVGSQSSVDIQAPHDVVTIGGYWMHGDYRNPVALFNPAQGTSRYNPAFFNSDHMYNDYGFLFIQDRIDLFNNRLIITPGAAEQMFRTDYYNTGLVHFPDAPPANDPEQAPDAHKNFSHFAPSVGVQYLVANWFTLHGNAALTYQNPADSAFGANRPTNGVDLSTLKAVKSANTEAGFLITKCPAAIFGSCSLDATYFRDQLTNETVITSVANSNVPATIALASALYNGVSVNFDDATTRHIQIHGNGIIQHDYFLSYVPNGTSTNYSSYPISNSPKYTTNLGITTIAGSSSTIFQVTPGLWWQYVGTRYLFSNLTTAPTTQSMPGYGVVNFNMDATLNGLGHIFHNVPSRIANTPIQISLGVENLLNKEYNPTAYITSGGYFGTSFGGYTIVDPGAPREYIMSINIGVK